MDNHETRINKNLNKVSHTHTQKNKNSNRGPSTRGSAVCEQLSRPCVSTMLYKKHPRLNHQSRGKKKNKSHTLD